ncbi:toxin-antitoxin system HicB family antitoxin [Pectobacterium cacticida]|uniref:toxin-antitoxin system HicB family antitoxin n=1 Tax=Pectobacterium cacticida TaxID=69221 RepID=UPI002FF2F985
MSSLRKKQRETLNQIFKTPVHSGVKWPNIESLITALGGEIKEGSGSQENGIAPYEREEKVKTFTLRYPESFGERLTVAAAEHQVPVNAFILDTLNERMKHA